MNDKIEVVVKTQPEPEASVQKERSPLFFSQQLKAALPQTNNVALDAESKELLRSLLVELQLHNNIELKKMEIESSRERLAELELKQAEIEDQQRFSQIRDSMYL